MLRIVMPALALAPAALGALLLGAADGGRAVAASGHAGVECEIRADEGSFGTTLEAVVRSETRIAGDYVFSVAKRGGGGTSTSLQSGDFAVDAGGEEVVGEVTIGLGRGATYDAELALEWDGGETTCRAPD